VVIYDCGVPGAALSLKATNYLDEGHHGDRPLFGKIPMEGPGIEPGTSCLVVRGPDHQATRLVLVTNIFVPTLMTVTCTSWVLTLHSGIYH
jgi:hypothetical protein